MALKKTTSFTAIRQFIFFCNIRCIYFDYMNGLLSEVDGILFESGPKSTPFQDCHDFQAGEEVLRTKTKNDKLDVTGIFGSVCRHDHPVKFLNLKHNER